MHYYAYLADGLPIATGVIEGACRYLVKVRMDITGARWFAEGAEAVLCLRALRASGDFDVYWEYHRERERQRNHLRRYAGARPPALDFKGLESTDIRAAPHLGCVNLATFDSFYTLEER